MVWGSEPKAEVGGERERAGGGPKVPAPIKILRHLLQRNKGKVRQNQLVRQGAIYGLAEKGRDS